MTRRIVFGITAWVISLVIAGTACCQDQKTSKHLEGTSILQTQGDLADQMISGIDTFLSSELKASESRRKKFWSIDTSSPEAFAKSVEPNRRHLAYILGVRDKRVVNDGFELIATTNTPALIAECENFTVRNIRWQVIGEIYGEGLLLEPKGAVVANVIAIPDYDMEPEHIVMLDGAIPLKCQYARCLAERGCRVVVPTLINRTLKRRGPPGSSGRANLTNREFAYRSSFELGRHIIGYEIQKILAAVDILDATTKEPLPLGVTGYAEGGRLAMYAAALDTRIDVVQSESDFGTHGNIPVEPIDNNVFGLLEKFGESYLQVLIAPRKQLTNMVKPKGYNLPSEGGAPSRIVFDDTDAGSFNLNTCMQRSIRESDLSRKTLKAFKPGEFIKYKLYDYQNAERPFGYVADFLQLLTPNEFPQSRDEPQPLAAQNIVGKIADPAQRQQRQLNQIIQYNARLLTESPYVRTAFMKDLDTSSLEAFQESQSSYRKHFREKTIGKFDQPLLAANARSRLRYEQETWTGYDVVLDVYDDVFAYGVILLPNDIQPDEKRPVIVCQHGLEGRPKDTIEGDHRAYHDFAAKLAERGFVVFAPQNPYIFKDRFRNLQRKANPLGKSLFSIITAQHQQIVNWLGEQPFVDKERIGFYGLSYGGKTAMRVPALVDGYCLSICSADFNDWVWKNASTRSKYSYVWTGEYEIFEFDLGSTFNYSEMAALIAPRPFMVERGHFDGVAPDHRVASEFAKVRHLYQAKLGIGDRCEIEWFAGPHTINGKATFEFLHRHLRWPRR